MLRERYNQLSSEILDASITVHKEMGPSLLESVYEISLMKEFELKKEFRIDILIENEIIIDIKSSEIMHPVYEAQILSYLKLANKKLGFLINFNIPLLKNEFSRFVKNF